MNKYFSRIVVCAALSLFCSASSWAADAVKLINPVFYSKEQTAEYLTTGTAYLANWGTFDVLSRLKRDGVSYDDVVAFVKDQTRSWNEEDKESAMKGVAGLNAIIKKEGYKLPLPEKIPFMLSSMNEEGGCLAYTRKEGVAFGSSAEVDIDSRLIAHELFHVLTRNNPDFKKKIYELIGFNTLKKDIAVPESFKNRMISNPDVDHHNTYATFKIGGKKVDCAMFIYSDEEWNGGSFFDYLKVGLLEIDKEKCELVLKDGEPVIHDVDEAEDFYDKVGNSTSYIIDPEEILADNFSFLLCYGSDSDLCVAMRKLLLK